MCTLPATGDPVGLPFLLDEQSGASEGVAEALESDGSGIKFSLRLWTLSDCGQVTSPFCPQLRHLVKESSNTQHRVYGEEHRSQST